MQIICDFCIDADSLMRRFNIVNIKYVWLFGLFYYTGRVFLVLTCLYSPYIY